MRRGSITGSAPPSASLTALRVLAVTIVAVSILPSIVVAGCGGSKGSSASDAGNATALAHVTSASARPDTGPPSGAAATSMGPDSGVVDEPVPAADLADLTLRGRHLLEAIGKDEPKLASDIVFPRDAFIATKDLSDPGKQWDKKFYPIFERDVHTLRKKLRVPEQAQFVSFELGPSVVQVFPKKRDLKRAVWRVRHSKLTFAVAGKPQRIEIAEMTSWRGAWYISKLR